MSSIVRAPKLKEREHVSTVKLRVSAWARLDRLADHFTERNRALISAGQDVEGVVMRRNDVVQDSIDWALAKMEKEEKLPPLTQEQLDEWLAKIESSNPPGRKAKK